MLQINSITPDDLGPLETMVYEAIVDWIEVVSESSEEIAYVLISGSFEHAARLFWASNYSIIVPPTEGDPNMNDILTPAPEQLEAIITEVVSEIVALNEDYDYVLSEIEEGHLTDSEGQDELEVIVDEYLHASQVLTNLMQGPLNLSRRARERRNI